MSLGAEVYTLSVIKKIASRTVQLKSCRGIEWQQSRVNLKTMDTALQHIKKDESLSHALEA